MKALGQSSIDYDQDTAHILETTIHHREDLFRRRRRHGSSLRKQASDSLSLNKPRKDFSSLVGLFMRLPRLVLESTFCLVLLFLSEQGKYHKILG